MAAEEGKNNTLISPSLLGATRLCNDPRGFIHHVRREASRLSPRSGPRHRLLSVRLVLGRLRQALLDALCKLRVVDVADAPEGVRSPGANVTVPSEATLPPVVSGGLRGEARGFFAAGLSGENSAEPRLG